MQIEWNQVDHTHRKNALNQIGNRLPSQVGESPEGAKIRRRIIIISINIRSGRAGAGGSAESTA